MKPLPGCSERETSLFRARCTPAVACGQGDTRSHPRQLKPLAIFPRQVAVGFPVVDKLLGLRIERESAAEHVAGLVERHFVVAKMLLHTGEGFAGFLVVAEGARRAVELRR